MRSSLTYPWGIVDYVEVLKPGATFLLTFIGGCAAVVAAGGEVSAGMLGLILLTVALGSAGCNGLTNYLDREVDARMLRTKHRVLPSGRIKPPQKVLFLVSGLIAAGLVLAWFLHPLCFLAGAIGVVASAVWRKTVSCTFLGIVASCSPVLIGWFAVRPVFDFQILLLCLLVAVWVPIHVWSVMIANREDYLNAGLNYFPLSWSVRNIVKTLFILSLLLTLISVLLFLIAGLHILYLVMATVFGIVMVIASANLLFSTTPESAWRLYKLSAYPYLGIIFLAMSLDAWLF